MSRITDYMSAYDVAEWLYEDATDAEFAETFVLLDIMKHGKIENGLSKEQMLNANTKRITEELKSGLDEILPINSECDTDAWWKK